MGRRDSIQGSDTTSYEDYMPQKEDAASPKLSRKNETIRANNNRLQVANTQLKSGVYAKPMQKRVPSSAAGDKLWVSTKRVSAK